MRTAGALLALVLLALSACDSEPGIIIDIGAWPADVETLRVRSRLNGISGAEQTVEKGQTRFVVFVPKGTVGNLSLELAGLDTHNCRAASGQIEQELGVGLFAVQEVPVTLALISPVSCFLTVVVPGGSLSSDRLGIDCDASKSPCVFELPLGTGVHLFAANVDPNLHALWNQTCTGYGHDCNVLMDQNRTVSLQWEKRLCSVDGWCWVNPVNGFVPSALKFNQSGEAWIGGGGPSVLKCKEGNCAVIPATLARGALSSLSPRGDDELWGIRDGLLHRCVGGSCAPIFTNPHKPLSSVSVNKSGEVWAVGPAGAMVRCDGNTCIPQTPLTSWDLQNVSLNDSGEMWAVGSKDTIIHCRNGSCALVPPSMPAGELQVNVYVDPTGAAWVMGRVHMQRCQDNTCVEVIKGALYSDLPLPGLMGNPPQFHIGKSGAIWMDPLHDSVQRCEEKSCTTIAIDPMLTSENAISDADTEIGFPIPLLLGIARCTRTRCVQLPINTDGRIGILETSPTGQLWMIDLNGRIQRCSGSTCVGSTTPSYTLPLSGVSSAYGSTFVISVDSLILNCSPTSCSRTLSGLEGGSYGYWPTSVTMGGVGWIGGQIGPSSGFLLRCTKDGKCSSVVTDLSSSVVGLSTSRDAVWGLFANGRVARCTDLGCATVYTDSTGSLLTVGADSNDTAWLVGAGGAVVQCTAASGCMPRTSGTVQNLTQVSANASRAIATGSMGAIVICNGNSCAPPTQYVLPLPYDLRGVSLNGMGQGWAVGVLGTVVYCGGSICIRLPLQPGSLLNGVAASSGGFAWAVGSSGAILRCTTNTCVMSQSGTGNDLNSVSIGLTHTFVVGNGGTVLAHAN